MSDALRLTDATPDDAPKAKLTEADLLAMLREKLCKPGNGGAGEYALMPQVRNGAGFNANRTFDAVAVSLWPSRGFLVDCYEIKCSRSDWLRELKEPAKAEAAAKYCDRFSIVAADSSIVQSGELPPTWGLLVVSGSSLRTVVAAPMLPEADPSRPVQRSFLVPLLRAAGGVPATPAEIKAARSQGVADGQKYAAHDIDNLKSQLAEVKGLVADFESAAGVRLGGWNMSAENVGRAVRSVLASERAEDDAQRKLQHARNALADGLAALDKVLTSGDAPRG